MQEERAMRISSKNNAITMAISTIQKSTCSCSTMIRKMGPKKEFSMDSLELRAAVGCEKVQLGFVQDSRPASTFISWNSPLLSMFTSLAILSRFRPFKPASMFVYFYVTHHCFLPFISIHFFAESEFIFPFWQTLMPVIFP